MKIAIAGGIGSGKSAVTRILRGLGAKVVVADEVNAELMQDPQYVALIANSFPTVVNNNSINKKELAQIVYHDETKRKELMALSHPKIFDRMFSMYKGSDVVFYEIPLLTKTDVAFDAIWYVDAKHETRVSRIVLRDGVSEGYAKNVISLQREEESVKSIATEIISNDGDESILEGQVKALYCSILERIS